MHNHLDDGARTSLARCRNYGSIQSLVAKSKHVPFRESKLTHLLQSSLSGDGKAVMFANVSPRSVCVRARAFAHVHHGLAAPQRQRQRLTLMRMAL